MSRRRLIVVGAAVVVLAVAVAVGGVFLANRSDSDVRATPSPSAQPSPSESAPELYAFTKPTTIGQLSLAADQSLADQAALQLAVFYGDPFSAYYEETGVSHAALVWGFSASIPLIFQEKKIEEYFDGVRRRLKSGLQLGVPAVADPGTLGGQMQCANIDGEGRPQRLCVWTKSNVLIGVGVTGFEEPQAAGMVSQALSAVVVRKA